MKRERIYYKAKISCTILPNYSNLSDCLSFFLSEMAKHCLSFYEALPLFTHAWSYFGTQWFGSYTHKFLSDKQEA